MSLAFFGAFDGGAPECLNGILDGVAQFAANGAVMLACHLAHGVEGLPIEVQNVFDGFVRPLAWSFLKLHSVAIQKVVNGAFL